MRGEGIAYARKLINAGVDVKVKEYAKALYMLLLIDKLLEPPVIDDVVKVVRTVVGPRHEESVSDPVPAPVTSDD
jgi:hypothetical protein